MVKIILSRMASTCKKGAFTAVKRTSRCTCKAAEVIPVPVPQVVEDVVEVPQVLHWRDLPSKKA